MFISSVAQIPPIDSAAFNPDSAKVAITNLAQKIVEDPNTFVQQLIQDSINFGLKVLAAILIYIVGAWLIRRVKGLLRKMFERRKTEKTLSSFVTSLVSITMTVILVIVTIGALGVNTTSLAALLAAGGMAIGMALSGTVQNFAGGIMILAFKPFKAGDYIEALGYSGIVSEVNIVSTKLRTFDNKTVVLPNGTLFNGNIVNHFERAVSRLDWLVELDYGTDNDTAKQIMMDLMKKDPRILDSSVPGASDPFVAINALKDSSVEYVMKGWVKVGDYWDVMYDMNEAIFVELPKKGISFPFPQLDVHVKKKD